MRIREQRRGGRESLPAAQNVANLERDRDAPHGGYGAPPSRIMRVKYVARLESRRPLLSYRRDTFGELGARVVDTLTTRLVFKRRW